VQQSPDFEPKMEEGAQRGGDVMSDTKNPRDPVSRILDLSRRVSIFSPAMKPFVRFASGKPGAEFCRRHLWDFDDLLQKELLRRLRQAVSPEEIARACTEQWQRNSQSLYDAGHMRLESGCPNVNEPPYAVTRRNVLQGHLGRNSRILYIGCGSGRDCLAWAREGFRIVGIDTDLSLVKLARNWNDHLRYPAFFAGMDMRGLGFRPGTFDGFLLELYGGLPDAGHAVALQGELAKVLRQDGVGLVVAERKMYPCWWFLMGTSWPDPMVKWLRGQVFLDLRFGKRDACEERLQYGLFSRCHTMESLSAELSRTFEVLSCSYQADPRYVLAAVRKKGCARETEAEEEEESPRPETAAVDLSAITDLLENVEVLCTELERHADRVASYFHTGGSGARCLTELGPGVEPALSMLEYLACRGSAGTRSMALGKRLPLTQRPGKGIRRNVLLG
jgi:SAM-dependent methyltransferase